MKLTWSVSISHLYFHLYLLIMGSLVSLLQRLKNTNRQDWKVAGSWILYITVPFGVCCIMVYVLSKYNTLSYGSTLVKFFQNGLGNELTDIPKVVSSTSTSINVSLTVDLAIILFLDKEPFLFDFI